MKNHLYKVTFLTERFPTKKHYPFSLPLIQDTKQLNFNTPVTIFVGENGSGKSTLLEAIAVACGIYIWSNPAVSRVVRNKYEKQLPRYVVPEWYNGKTPGAFFGSETFKDFTYYLEQWASTDPNLLDYFGGKSLITQSHGESMLSYFRTRYKLKGVYFLDEPETALSPKSQLKLMEIIEECSLTRQAQFIMVSHSPILLACKGATIYNFNKIPVDKTEYKETEHYQVYKKFLMER